MAEWFITSRLNNKDDPMVWSQYEHISGQLIALPEIKYGGYPEKGPL